jgi:putative Holliday junction resolvase
MRYLGIDFGSKDVGVAITDEGGSMAFPKTVIPNTASLVDDIAQVIDSEGVGAVVVGYSKNNQGEDNLIMADIARFCESLSKKAGVEMHFEPEQYSSKEAERLQDTTAKLDASAAAIILNSFLSRKNQRSVLDDIE